MPLSNSLTRLEVFCAEWALIAILLGYPFSATLSILLGVSSTPISITYRAGYLFMALVIILIELLVQLLEEKRYSVYLLPLTLFWIAYIIRMYHDFFIVGFSKGYASKGFNFFFQYGFLGSFLPAFAMCLVVNKIDFQRVFKNLRMLSVFVLACLFYVIYIEFGIGIEVFLMRFALGGEEAIINPIILSQYGGFIAVLAFYSMCFNKTNLYDLGLWILGVILLILGSSRGPLIAFLGTHLLIIGYIIKIRFKSLKMWGYLLLALMLFIMGFIYFVVPVLDNILLFNRVESSFNEGSGLDARTLQWTSAWNQFLDSPIFGDLIVERAINFYPHNLVLEVLMSLGLIGGFIFLVLLWKFLRNYFLIKDIYKRFIFYIMIVHFLYAMFSLSIISIPQFWCALAIGMSLNLTIRKELPILRVN